MQRDRFGWVLWVSAVFRACCLCTLRACAAGCISAEQTRLTAVTAADLVVAKCFDVACIDVLCFELVAIHGTCASTAHLARHVAAAGQCVG